jgi:type II secretory pathway pseudopilin PulG
MKHAFTYVELIFVIIVVGVLSSVALPKLRSITTDARASKVATEVESAGREIINYSLFHQYVDKNMSRMSSIIKHMEESGDADCSHVYKVLFPFGNVSDCIVLWVQNPTNENRMLIMEYGNKNSDECSVLRNLVDKSRYPARLIY